VTTYGQVAQQLVAIATPLAQQAAAITWPDPSDGLAITTALEHAALRAKYAVDDYVTEGG